MAGSLTVVNNTNNFEIRLDHLYVITDSESGKFISWGEGYLLKGQNSILKWDPEKYPYPRLATLVVKKTLKNQFDIASFSKKFEVNFGVLENDNLKTSDYIKESNFDSTTKIKRTVSKWNNDYTLLVEEVKIGD